MKCQISVSAPNRKHPEPVVRGEAVAKLQFRRQAGTDRGPFQSRTKVPPDGRNFLPPEVKNPRRMSPDFLHLQSKCYLMRANARNI